MLFKYDFSGDAVERRNNNNNNNHSLDDSRDSTQKYHNNIFIRNVSNLRLSFLIENEETRKIMGNA